MSLATVLFAAVGVAVAACGGDGDARGAQRLSRAEAITRIDAICRRSVAQVAQLGAEPQVASGSQLALERYARWAARAGAIVEAGLRRIERLAIPADGDQGEIRSYVYFARKAISQGRRLLGAIEARDADEVDWLSREMETSTDQAGFAAKRYGLEQCGG